MKDIKQATLFRVLILMATTSYLLWVFLPYLFSNLYSRETIDIVAYNGYQAIFVLPGSILWAEVIIWVFLAIGLFMFIGISRHLFLLLVVATYIMVPFSGLRSQTALESTLLDLTNLCDGAIIAMAYFSDLSERFRNS